MILKLCYFNSKVYSFFKERIEELYPLDPSPEDPIQAQREAHEVRRSFLMEPYRGKGDFNMPYQWPKCLILCFLQFSHALHSDCEISHDFSILRS